MGVWEEPGDGRVLLAEDGETRESDAGVTAKPGTCSTGWFWGVSYAAGYCWEMRSKYVLLGAGAWEYTELCGADQPGGRMAWDSELEESTKEEK